MAEKNFEKALAELAKLDVVKAVSNCIRVEDIIGG